MKMAKNHGITAGRGYVLKHKDIAVVESDKIESKPFRSKHTKQIDRAVKDFSWLNLDTLDGIEAEFAEILREAASNSPTSEQRNAKLCRALLARIELLRKIVNKVNGVLKLDSGVLSGVLNPDIGVLKCIIDNPKVTQTQIATLTGIPHRTVQRIMIRLQEQGKVERVNGKRDGYWVIK
jgi:DNA-binding transcriptional ArsR family regulator